MKIRDVVTEVITCVGTKYQDLYTQFYKRAHLAARKRGLDNAAADNEAVDIE